LRYCAFDVFEVETCKEKVIREAVLGVGLFSLVVVRRLSRKMLNSRGDIADPYKTPTCVEHDESPTLIFRFVWTKLSSCISVRILLSFRIL
jgi:hypothetical protein